jgi:hypothetical protein
MISSPKKRLCKFDADFFPLLTALAAFQLYMRDFTENYKWQDGRRGFNSKLMTEAVESFNQLNPQEKARYQALSMKSAEVAEKEKEIYEASKTGEQVILETAALVQKLLPQGQSLLKRFRPRKKAASTESAFTNFVKWFSANEYRKTVPSTLFRQASDKWSTLSDDQKKEWAQKK